MKVLVPMTLISHLMTLVSIVLVVVFYNWTVTIIFGCSVLLSLIGMGGLVISVIKDYHTD